MLCNDSQHILSILSVHHLSSSPADAAPRLRRLGSSETHTIMAIYQVTYWQEIPSQVDAKAPGEAPFKQPLSQRFLELIDLIATKRKLGGTDDYLAGWNKGKKTEREGSAADVARAVAEEFEAQYDSIRAQALAQGSASPNA